MPVVRESTVYSVREYLDRLDELRADLKRNEADRIPSAGHPTTFRGQPNDKPLKPSLPRRRPGPDMLHYEKKILHELQRLLLFPRRTSWRWLAIAVCRRDSSTGRSSLSWGLFFEEINFDAAKEPGFVFGTHHERKFIGELDGPAPCCITERIFLLPPLATPTVQAQLSVLAAWPDPATPFEPAYPVWKFEIPADDRRSVQIELDRLGVNRAPFPDLTGAWSHLAWKAWTEPQ